MLPRFVSDHVLLKEIIKNNNPIRGIARRLFKSRHNMIEERSLGVKAPGEFKVECPYIGPV